MLLRVLPLASVPIEVSVRVLSSAETTDVPEATAWPPLVNLNERVLEAPRVTAMESAPAHTAPSGMNLLFLLLNLLLGCNLLLVPLFVLLNLLLGWR